MIALRCLGCGREVPAGAPSPFRCPNAGNGGDHVLTRSLDALRLPDGGSQNPFIRYRALTYAYALALSRGMTDEGFVALVSDLDAAVARVAGRGFSATPFARNARLSDAVGLSASGGVWVKDETRNVSGSHKARHLMGLAILLEVDARTGQPRPKGERLAIASCGNAALAAAVVASAIGKPLDVFIPQGAHPRVVTELARLGATLHVCARREGEKGDPCYLAFRRAVVAGALPFCCQGSENGLAIEGGETLGWEMIAELAREGRSTDRLFVQVGGGALASACVAAFRDAGVRMPRLHAVQTQGAFPLQRAWERVSVRAGADGIEAALSYAAQHREEFMVPWETEPKSVATGILDDETYDWLAVVRGALESGGCPVVVDEATLLEANALGRETTGIDVDPTGTAGLAGLLAVAREGEGRSGLGVDENVTVLFTGVKR